MPYDIDEKKRLLYEEEKKIGDKSVRSVAGRKWKHGEYLLNEGEKEEEEPNEFRLYRP